MPVRRVATGKWLPTFRNIVTSSLLRSRRGRIYFKVDGITFNLTNVQSTGRNNTEDLYLQRYRCENLKSHKVISHQ
jgi:hypothetical protein